jgi:hypothetical protein
MVYLLHRSCKFPTLLLFFMMVSRQEKKIKPTVLLHDAEELDNDLGARSDQDLALTGLLGVVDGVERIVEDGSSDHFDG